MKLYSGPLSLFTAKVRIALAEKGLDYERIEVGWSPEHRYEPHHPDVVALNPKKQVPVLVDGDVVVTDSTLIFEYLEERSPDPPLYPEGLAARARCRRLEAGADELLFPFVWDLIEERFYSRPGGEDAARTAAATQGIAAYEEGLEKQLAEGPYLCGRFGVADIANFIFVSTAASLGAPPPAALTGVNAWLARTAGRPAVKQELAEIAAFRASLAG